MTVRGFPSSLDPSAGATPPRQRTRIKICGVGDVPTAAACADAGADFVGLVFVHRSPRHVEVADAAGIVRSLTCFGLHAPTPVGLFCDHGRDHVLRVVEAAGLTIVQLHGTESRAEVAALAAEGLTVWKAVPFAPERLARWAGAEGLAAPARRQPSAPAPGRRREGPDRRPRRSLSTGTRSPPPTSAASPRCGSPAGSRRRTSPKPSASSGPPGST